MIRTYACSLLLGLLLVGCQSQPHDVGTSRLAVTPVYELTYPATLTLSIDSGHPDMNRFVFRRETRPAEIIVEAGPYCSNLASEKVEPVMDSTYFHNVVGRLPAEEREHYVYVGQRAFNPDSLVRDNIYWGMHAGLSFKKLVPRKPKGPSFYGYHFYCLEHIGTLRSCIRLNIYTPAGDSATFTLIDSLAMSLRPR